MRGAPHRYTFGRTARLAGIHSTTHLVDWVDRIEKTGTVICRSIVRTMVRLRSLLMAAALLLAVVSGSAVTEVRDHLFVSAALQQRVHYRVLVPDDYARTTTRYPVLYLLHGHGGVFSNWSDRTTVAEDMAGRPLIVVMPDGANSWYVDGANGEAWETYLTKDLIAEIDANYRTVPTRDGRMIAGLSMGGYGAVKAGLKHPELYSFVGSFSGAHDITRPGDVFRGESKPDVMSIFGPIGSVVRTSNDVYALAASASPADVPYFWIACGSNDPWLEPNRELVRVIKSRGLRYEYHERPGGHDWGFWQWSIRALLADPHLPARH